MGKQPECLRKDEQTQTLYVHTVVFSQGHSDTGCNTAERGGRAPVKYTSHDQPKTHTTYVKVLCEVPRVVKVIKDRR